MQANDLKLLILDVDGVLTSGKKMYDSTGKVIGKEFSDLDFTAIKMFKAQGVKVLWLSGDNFNREIATKRHIDFISTKGTNKVTSLDYIAKMYNAELKNMLYIGDDIYDLDIMIRIADHGGMAYCTQESPTLLKTNFEALGWAGENLVLRLYEMYFSTQLLTPGDMNDLYGLPRFEGLTIKNNESY